MSNELITNNNTPSPDANKPIAQAGTADQAKDGVSANLGDTKASLSGAVGSLQNFAKGKGSMLDAGMAVKGAVDSVRGLSGKISESVMMPIMTKLAVFKGTATLPAAKQLDPVLGIDVHVVNLPPPVPTPLPHPYIAILMRPKDWVSCMINTYKPQIVATATDMAGSVSSGAGAAVVTHGSALFDMAMGLAGLSASVKFGGYVPRAITGTTAKNFPHIPFGAGWHPAFAVPIKKNHGKVFLGSLFVTADGDPMAGMFHLNFDCWDVGIIDLFKFKRNGAKKSPDPSGPQLELYVPSGTLLPIPWGRPVLVNSIPTPINPLSIADKLFKSGLGKLAKSKAAQKAREKAIGKLPLSCATKTKLSKKYGTGQSHPVEVAEGYFYTDNEDFSLPGPIPLSWERTWYSYSPYKGPLGHGWHHSYDMAMAIDHDLSMATLRMTDGRGMDIPLPKDTKTASFHRVEKLHLHLHEDGYYFIEDTDGLQYRFTQKEYTVHGNPLRQQLLQSIANTNGYALRFAYTDKGYLDTITDSSGRLLTVENDTAGRITVIYAPHPDDAGRTFAIARYSYTGEGDMVSHTDALGQPMTFEYEGHQMVKEVWRNGLAWQFWYSGTGTNAKCVEVRGDGGLLHYKFDYTDPQCTVVTDSLGHCKQFYHQAGRVIKYIDANGGAWEYRYNRHSELEWETDPLGNQTGYTHDDRGNIVTVTEPDGLFSQTGYYNIRYPHLPTEATDARGGKWEWAYDGAGNLVKRKDPLGAVTKFDYEDGLLQRLTDALGTATLLKYDKQYNLHSITAPNGATTCYRYDMLGQTTQVSNPNGALQTRMLDKLGRATTINDFDDNVIQLQYDALDNVVVYKDRKKEVRYTYKGLWKLTSRSEAGATIRFAYDTEEQLRHIVNEQGDSYDFELDPAGNVIAESGFDGLLTRYQRNKAGWVTTQQKPSEKIVNYEHDATGRVVKMLYHDGTESTYTYDKGELAEARNEDAVVKFERDILGNVIKENANGNEITTTYDILQRRTKISSTLGADIALDFDELDNVTNMFANGWQSEFKYDNLGLEIERNMLAGVSSYIQRDKLGRIKSHRVAVGHSKAAPARLYKQYVWDANDQLRQIVDHKKGATTFEHDTWGNLAKTTFADGEVQLRNPDKVGNLFETKDRRDRKYDKGGRLLESKTAKYSYDEEGFLIKKELKNGEVWRYEWNAAGMLAKVLRPDKNSITFAYDALGRRIFKKFRKTATRWVWDGNKPLHEYKEFDFRESTADDFITWIFEEDSFAPAAKIKGEKKYSLVCDHLGTPTQGYNEEGEKIWERELDSYGKKRQEVGDEGFCGITYQGQVFDKDIELTFNYFRWYNQEEGIYCSQDPIGLLGGAKLYHYVADSNSQIDCYGLATYRRKNGQFGKKPGRKSNKDNERELESARTQGVRDAWKQEADLVRREEPGTRRWNEAEINELKETGKVKGYEGHHINSVKGDKKRTHAENLSNARNPNNIKFLTPDEHLVAHDNSFHKPTSGPLLNR